MAQYDGKRYDGKRVLITGGTSGIGLATAQRLVAGGACVLVTGRAKGSFDQEGPALGAGATFVQSDAASLTDIQALADRAKAEFGTLDALVVNAGISAGGPFEDVTEATYDTVMDVNAKGAYFLVQRCISLMAEGAGIVFTTSVANVLGIPGISAYAASKAALRSMARTLARELLPHSIRVNAVSPGAIDTSALDRVMPKEAADQARAQFAESNPMQRLGRADEVAKAIAFLAFDATYTTGAELAVDGGGSQL